MFRESIRSGRDDPDETSRDSQNPENLNFCRLRGQIFVRRFGGPVLWNLFKLQTSEASDTSESL